MSHQQADGVTRQRHLVAWLARRLTDRSTTAIGRVLNRCHSVIVRAVGRIEAEMQLDAVLRADAEAIAHRLRTRLADDPPGRGADQLAVDAMVSTALQFADASERDEPVLQGLLLQQLKREVRALDAHFPKERAHG